MKTELKDLYVEVKANVLEDKATIENDDKGMFIRIPVELKVPIVKTGIDTIKSETGFDRIDITL